ncbi:MAG: hypothetical protein JNL39_18600 [Opitutaceae bacterium]|nr:hypothetical protein [Opitutaceae bacterium]
MDELLLLSQMVSREHEGFRRHASSSVLMSAHQWLTRLANLVRAKPAQEPCPDDSAWEQQLVDSRPLPKLDAFLCEYAAEENDETLDLKRL